jgi:hypothetical protein
MRFYLSTFSRAIMALLLFNFLWALPQFGYAQKILSEMETYYVMEAHSELKKALSDPAMDQAERLRIVERSARTLKEYGQPPAFPNGDIPLKQLMQGNYNQARDQYNDVNDLRRQINTMNHEARMKFINQLQIEVVEEQVKFLIPSKGVESHVFNLSKDLVNTVFDWNIAEGINRGEMDDAKTLVELFKKSAAANKLSGQLDKLFNDHKFTMENLHRDLNLVGPLENQLRKRYELAAAGTHTIKGYEGALLYGHGITAPAPNATSLNIDQSLLGTWLHTDNMKKQSGWQFNEDGTAVQYIRDKRITGWRWEVRGGMLYIIGGNGKSEDYAYKFENGALFMEVTLLGQQVWSAPMSKQ